MSNKTLADQVIEAMKGWLLRNVQPLFERVKALEEREPVRGEKGDRGDDGRDGKDADLEVIAKTIAEEVARLPLPKDGRDGEPGQNGKDGAAGDRGERGEKGEKGDKGDKGERGDPGLSVKGEPGDPGRDGRDGEPGRDAAHVDVLDGIDPAKRYQRGTYAYHRGGMVRSFKQTDPLQPDADLEKCGWHVVVRGIDECAVDLDDDLRTVRVRLAFSDGAVVQKQLTVPTMIYRGIWADGAHQHGDVVTRDGSAWVAKADTTTRPGDEGSDWQLAVKRGRDGRDGLKGEKGERGAEGRAGRDLTQMSSDGHRY